METQHNGATILSLLPELNGRILDIGGGGEGIIGRLYGNQVTAIDQYQEELEEFPDCCEKVQMDAANLLYQDGFFDHVTFFYSLMYMDEVTQRQALREAARVCKKGGKILVWDCQIESAYPQPFLTELTIHLPGQTITTTYGIVKLGKQSLETLTDICRQCGLDIVFTNRKDGHFHIACKKTGSEP